MKALSLWAGHDYAHIPYRGRGQAFAHNVERVKVIKTEARKNSVYAKKESTYVDVKVLDWDGNETGVEKEVRARDIADFWDTHWNEYSEQLLQQKAYREEQEIIKKQREDEYRKQREDREAAEAARREKLQQRRNAIRQGLHNKGLVFDSDLIYGEVRIADDGNSVTIRGTELLRWLDIEVENNVQSVV